MNADKITYPYILFQIPVSTRVSFTVRDRSGMMAVHTLVNVLMLTKDSTDVLRSRFLRTSSVVIYHLGNFILFSY